MIRIQALKTIHGLIEIVVQLMWFCFWKYVVFNNNIWFGSKNRFSNKTMYNYDILQLAFSMVYKFHLRTKAKRLFCFSILIRSVCIGVIVTMNDILL